ncbi:MAG: hypothetical protein K9J13_13900 [Saprospiraceae bacterium]|nr:hypothetical protein [Saprospiraceae bacterium]
MKIITFIIENWQLVLGVIALLYEIILRRIPTARDLSIINLIFKILTAIMPNNAKYGTGDKKRFTFFKKKTKKL